MLPAIVLTSACLAFAASSCAAVAPLTNLVTFGDSYTDNGRLGYYIGHGGQAPPPGTYQTVTNTTASGGLTWAQYVAQSSGANLVDYAVSGAVCSNDITPRLFPLINRTFPAILNDEIPSYKADLNFSTKFYPSGRTAQNTVYAVWIGTNDLGTGLFLNDAQVKGKTLTDFVECVWTVWDNVYQSGGRRFVLLNEAPLDIVPLYKPLQDGGAPDNQFWTNKTAYNQTEYAQKIRESSTSVNTMFDYGAPFQLVVKKRWPGATFSIFNVHQLLLDIYNNPKQYLDPPANSTGYYHHCQATNNQNCTNLNNLGSLSSFMWYDELHPSNKTDSVIARTFLDVLAGNSSYGTTYTVDAK